MLKYGNPACFVAHWQVCREIIIAVFQNQLSQARAAFYVSFYVIIDSCAMTLVSCSLLISAYDYSTEHKIHDHSGVGKLKNWTP